MKLSWIKEKLFFYTKNYVTYLLCVVILSKLIGSPIPWVNMAMMLIALIILLEVTDFLRNFRKRKLYNSENTDEG